MYCSKAGVYLKYAIPSGLDLWIVDRCLEQCQPFGLVFRPARLSFTIVSALWACFPACETQRVIIVSALRAWLACKTTLL